MRGSANGRKDTAPVSVWGTYLLLAIAMLLPVVCVVWLTRKAVESENEVVHHLLAEADVRRLKDSETALRELIESPEPEVRELGVAYRMPGESTRKDSPLGTGSGRDELAAARLSLAGKSSENVEDWLLEKLDNREYMSLTFSQGRHIGPVILEMALESANDLESFSDAFWLAADRYVLAFADSDGPFQQKRYLLSQYETISDSDTIRSKSREFERINAWIKNLVDRDAYPPNYGLGGSEESFYFRSETSEEVVIFPKENLPPLFELLDAASEGQGIRLRMKGDADSDLEQEYITLPLAAPLDFAMLQIKPTDLSNVSSQKASLYIWIGVIVLTLSLLAGFAIAFSLRRQASVTELKDNLVATVTHELKTPVSSIRLLVDTLLEQDRRGKVDTDTYLRLISRENERLGRLIDNFLSFSRMERNKSSFLMESIPVEEVVKEAETAFRDRYARNDYLLECSIEGGIPPVLGEREALSTVVGNLLENAYKYGGKEKRIVLQAKKGEREAVFEVEDFGLGISKRDQKRIFRKFFRADESEAEHPGSVGLGLAIVEFIVVKHSGRIEVESELGKGSVFKVRIPYA